MKYKAKPAIETFFVRVGDGLAAVTVLLGVRFYAFSIRSLLLFNIALVVLWFIVGMVIVRELATIEDRAVVEKILTHLGLPADPPCPSPARTPEWLPGVRRTADHEHAAGGHWAD